MADVIGHDAGVHNEAAAALSNYYAAIQQLESDLQSTANHLVHPDVWTGPAADTFLEKHRSLMKDVEALKDSVKTLNVSRQDAHEDIRGADGHVRRMFTAH